MDGKTLIIFTTSQILKNETDLFNEEHTKKSGLENNLKAYWAQQLFSDYLLKIIESNNFNLALIADQGFREQAKKYLNEWKNASLREEKDKKFSALKELLSGEETIKEIINKHQDSKYIPTEDDIQKNIWQIEETNIFATYHKSEGKTPEDFYIYLKAFYKDILDVLDEKNENIKNIYFIFHDKDIGKTGSDIKIEKDLCEKIKDKLELPIFPEIYIFQHASSSRIYTLLSKFPWEEYKNRVQYVVDYLIKTISFLEDKKKVYEFMEDVLLNHYSEYLKSKKDIPIELKDKKFREAKWLWVELKNKLMNTDVKEYSEKKELFTSIYEKMEKNITFNTNKCIISSLKQFRAKLYDFLNILPGDIYPRIYD